MEKVRIDNLYSYGELKKITDIRNGCSEAFSNTSQLSYEDSLQWWMKNFHYNHEVWQRYFVIYLNDVLVGSIYWEYLSGAEDIEIGKIMLDTEYRGRGIIQVAIALLLARVPHERAWLSVKADNIRAIKAYEKAGFVESGLDQEGENLLMYKINENIRNDI